MRQTDRKRDALLLSESHCLRRQRAPVGPYWAGPLTHRSRKQRHGTSAV